MNRYILTLIICISIPVFLNAQSLTKAKKQMDKYNYAEAIKILKPLSTDEKSKQDAIPLLAECYRKQHDVPNAKSYYEKAVNLPVAKPETYFYYAQALQATGEYEKAKDMFSKYSKINPSDPKGKMYLAHCDSVMEAWTDLKPKYEAKLASNINTEQSDFGSAYYLGDLIFASDNVSPADTKLYGWTGRGYLNIRKSSPQVKDDFWSPMKSPSEFESKFEQKNHDGPAAFTSDGNTIYFTRSYYANVKSEGGYQTNRLKIFSATKTDGVWGELVPFHLNSDEYSVGHPTLSRDGQTLYFVSDMPGGQGGTDIWMCKRSGDSWGQASNLGPTINTKMNEMFPTIGDNEEMYFASEGHPGYGGLDIFVSKLINGNWSVPENMHPPINSSYDDFALSFAPGAKGGFFSSNRPAGIGSDDIYAFRILELPKPVQVQPKPEPVAVILPTCLSGFVKDKTTGKPIAGATVFLLDNKTGNVKVLKTDTEGKYEECNLKPTDYVVKAMMPNTIADCIQFPVTELKPGANLKASRDLLLDKLVLNKTFKIDNIYYDFDKYNIREDAKPELNKLVQIMHENAIDVELGSHTDCRGSSQYNDKLSQNRAQSAVDYIVGTGISKSRITAKGYGETQLKNKCADGVECSDAEHQENRRTEFKVTNFAPVQTTPDFDLSKFKGGEEVPSYVFGSSFFDVCSPKKNVATVNPTEAAKEKAIAPETKSQPAAANATPVNTNRPVITTVQNPGLYKFRVQFLAVSTEKALNDPAFENLNDIQVYHENKIYKYSSGLFKTEKEAQAYKDKMVKLGYKDAFVVTYIKGKLAKAK